MNLKKKSTFLLQQHYPSHTEDYLLLTQKQDKIYRISTDKDVHFLNAGDTIFAQTEYSNNDYPQLGSLEKNEIKNLSFIKHATVDLVVEDMVWKKDVNEIRREMNFNMGEMESYVGTPTARNLVETLKNRGYILVNLRDEDVNVLRGFKRRVVDEFLSMDMNAKKVYQLPGENRLYGYKHVNSKNKEYFKVRRSLNQQYPNETYKSECLKSFTYIRELSKSILKVILVYLGIDETEIQKLTNETPTEPQFDNATDFLEVFRYFSNNTDNYTIPCEYHVDVGLITLIPKSMGPAGLQLFDWREQSWINIETDATPNQCVVIAGDLLTRLSNSYINPTIHRVVLPPQTEERISMIYEILPHPHYMINCNLLDTSIVGKIGEQYSVSEPSFKVVNDTSKSRVSVNVEY